MDDELDIYLENIFEEKMYEYQESVSKMSNVFEAKKKEIEASKKRIQTIENEIYELQAEQIAFDSLQKQAIESEQMVKEAKLELKKEEERLHECTNQKNLFLKQIEAKEEILKRQNLTLNQYLDIQNSIDFKQKIAADKSKELFELKKQASDLDEQHRRESNKFRQEMYELEKQGVQRLANFKEFDHLVHEFVKQMDEEGFNKKKIGQQVLDISALLISVQDLIIDSPDPQDEEINQFQENSLMSDIMDSVFHKDRPGSGKVGLWCQA